MKQYIKFAIVICLTYIADYILNPTDRERSFIVYTTILGIALMLLGLLEMIKWSYIQYQKRKLKLIYIKHGKANTKRRDI